MRRRLIIIFLLIVTTGAKILAQKTEDVLAYIAAYKELAISEMKRTGIPAAIVLAQGIHETEAGTSDLVKKSNNHFGIKCKATWMGDKVFHDDDSRGECFRSYARPEDSYMDHSNFLKSSPRYAFLFDLDPTDYEGWAYGLRKAGYATNIRYSQILIKIINDYKLEDFTLIAMGKMKESDHLLASNVERVPLVQASSTIKEEPREPAITPSYPTGPFTINETKVIFVKASTAWLAVAEEYNIPLSRLWDFNDLEKDDDILLKGQLVYLQRKRKVGSTEYHVQQAGESLYDVCQAEGIRYESLLELNHLNNNMQPAAGERLYLQHPATSRPMLVSEKGNAMPLNPSSRAATSTAALRSENTGNLQAVNNDEIDAGAAKLTSFTTHTVATKETMYSISKKYGVDPEKIKEWNRLDSLNIKVGQALIIYKTR